MNNNRLTPFLASIDPDAPIPLTLAEPGHLNHKMLCQQLAGPLRELRKPLSDKVLVKRGFIHLLRADLLATRAGVETWQQRALAAEAALARHQRHAVRRELLSDVTIREITSAHAHWAPQSPPRLTLIERLWLWLTEAE